MGIRSLKTASISTGTKRSKVWDQSAVYSLSAYESIATTAVGAGGTSSISFTSIPSTYKHLQLRMINRSSTSGTGSDWVVASFNGDTTASNYSWHYLAGDNAAPSAGSSTTASGLRIGLQWSSTAAASGIFHGAVVDILDYQDTNKYKTMRALCGSNTDSGTYNDVFSLSGNWHSSSAVNSITITSNWTLGQYSHVALYGIKG